jgi:transglutaminase-like putative cysteine protease
MLESGELGGKCVDLSGWFIALLRSVGVPARELYGVRVGASQRYRSFSAYSENISKSQHCRAEVFLKGIGGMPTDPADVRKVMIEEPPHILSLDAPEVVEAQRALFGSWEGNWVPFNDTRDVALAGDAPHVINFLMYPQAEIAGWIIDCLDPDGFGYQIRSKELTV